MKESARKQERLHLMTSEFSILLLIVNQTKEDLKIVLDSSIAPTALTIIMKIYC